MSAYDRYSSSTNPYDDHQRLPTQRPQPARSTILNFDQDDDLEDRQAGVRDALLRESGHLTRSEQMLDEQYDIALKARESLIQQRSAINSMREGFNNITGRFSSVNELIKKIRVRKRRDTIIVAIVFSICLFLLLYHMLF